MADLLAHHAEADRLLSALAAEPPNELASRPGDDVLNALRALRAERPGDLNDEWGAYVERRGAVAVYSYLLTIVRAGMWPGRYVVETAVRGLPEDTAAVAARMGAAGARWDLFRPYDTFKAWHDRHNAITREFVVAPFDGHADARLWFVHTKSKIYALLVARYGDVLTADTSRVDEAHMARGVVHHFGRATPKA